MRLGGEQLELKAGWHPVGWKRGRHRPGGCPVAGVGGSSREDSGGAPDRERLPLPCLPAHLSFESEKPSLGAGAVQRGRAQDPRGPVGGPRC